jgi:hypothetical protein
MASTYTSRIRLEKQADGENPNSWGLILNQNVIDLVDEAIAGYAVVSVSSIPVSLTSNDGATDQARNMSIELAGTLTADVTITVPSQQKLYFIRENTNGSYVTKIKTAGGTAVELTQATNVVLACDGTDIYKVEAPTSVPTFTANTLTATSIATSVISATTLDFGTWTVTETGGVLYFASGGTNKMKLDSSGNLSVSGNITAYTSI